MPSIEKSRIILSLSTGAAHADSAEHEVQRRRCSKTIAGLIFGCCCQRVQVQVSVAAVMCIIEAAEQCPWRCLPAVLLDNTSGRCCQTLRSCPEQHTRSIATRDEGTALALSHLLLDPACASAKEPKGGWE